MALVGSEVSAVCRVDLPSVAYGDSSPRGGELRKRLTCVGLQPLPIRPNRAERIHRDRDPNHHERRIALRAHRLVQQEHSHTELDQRVEILDETHGQVMAVLHAVGERGQRNRGGQAGERHQQRDHGRQRGDQTIREHADGIRTGQRAPVQRQHAPADIGHEHHGYPHSRLLDSTNRRHVSPP